MKKILFILIMLTGFAFNASAQSGSYAGYAAAKDTLTNTETIDHVVDITGAKDAVSFQLNVIKLTGTISGTVKVYGSVDGTTYGTTAISSDTLVNATNNYMYSYSYNGYKRYKVEISTTGTGTASERLYLLYRGK